MTDVNSHLRTYRIAVLPERNMGRPQAGDALRSQSRAWQGTAIERPGVRLADCALSKAGSYAGRSAATRSYVEEANHGFELTRLLGWSISVLIHAVILAIAVLSNLHLTSLRTIPQKEPFRWEVSLMAAPRVEALVGNGIESQETAAVADIDLNDRAAARPLEQVEEGSSQWNESVLQETLAPAISPKQPADQEAVPKKFRRETDKFKRLTSAPVVSPAESIQPPPEVERQHDSNRLQVETQLESPTVLQRPATLTRELIDRTALPDYGWLMNALRAKLERVKVYPASAKAGHVQGRVVVQVSIGGDGRIVNPKIEESSGYSVLDHAALDALQAASPLTLSHRLNGPPIVMLIPLNYQLE